MFNIYPDAQKSFLTLCEAIEDNMANFRDLPAELRQRILELCLPAQLTIHNPLPPSILNLTQVNRRFRADIAAIIPTWSPLIVVCYPDWLRDLKLSTIQVDGRPLYPKLDRMVIDIFHESDDKNIQRTCLCAGGPYSHPELVSAWSDAIQQLPSSVREIQLDITPAPAKLRHQHRVAINPFLHDRLTMRFLDCHIQDVGSLVRKLHVQYHGRVRIALTGKLSEKALSIPSSISTQAGLDIEYVGSWITAADARFAKIRGAVELIAPRQHLWRAQKRGESYAYESFLRIYWSPKAKWLYAKLADEGEEADANRDLKTLAEFSINESVNMHAMNVARPLRRAYQHAVAKDMGLTTFSDGIEPNRHVIVEKQNAK